jgi:TIR domain
VIRRYIYEHTQLACFFDRHDIPHGHSVQVSIEDAIEGSMMVAVWTDKLLESPWCQLEIIEARRRQRPMLIVDALTTNTPRLFPFLGNMPVVRWAANPDFVVSLILLELIRAHHLQKIFEGFKAPSPAPDQRCRPDEKRRTFSSTLIRLSNPLSSKFFINRFPELGF